MLIMPVMTMMMKLKLMMMMMTMTITMMMMIMMTTRLSMTKTRRTKVTMEACRERETPGRLSGSRRSIRLTRSQKHRRNHTEPGVVLKSTEKKRASVGPRGPLTDTLPFDSSLLLMMQQYRLVPPRRFTVPAALTCHCLFMGLAIQFRRSHRPLLC